MTAKPASVRPSTSRTNPGSGGGRDRRGPRAPVQSAAKNRRNNTYSTAIATSHGTGHQQH